MNDEITVKAIRDAKKTDRLGLLVRYLYDKRSFAIMTRADEIRALTAFSRLMEVDIEMDRYATIRFYPVTEGSGVVKLDNAFKFIRNYLGLDTRQPLSAKDLKEKYPELCCHEVGKDEVSIERWFESIAIQILVYVREALEKLRIEEELAAERQRKRVVKEAKEKKNELHDPIVHNRWILPGKWDEFYQRRMERIARAKQ